MSERNELFKHNIENAESAKHPPSVFFDYKSHIQVSICCEFMI